jgi:purine-binding chemotaxis protein CheW
MDNLPDASRALLNYIDTLLLDDVALPLRGDNGPPPVDCLNQVAYKVDYATNIDVYTDSMQVILFKSAGIPLAIPLAAVSGILAIEQASSIRFISEEGEGIKLLTYRGRDIRVLDAKEIIFPEGHPARAAGAEEGFGHILVLEGDNCALGCDVVGDIVKMHRQDVEWRSNRRTRPWLAGMVKGSNHAFLDVKEIIGIIEGESAISH